MTLSDGSGTEDPAGPGSGEGSIALERLGRVFVGRDGLTVTALHELDLAVRPGEFVSVVGPSGCGKSTLLMTVAGLIEPTSGRVVIDGRPVEGPRRHVAIMFQTPELFPWRNVLDNVFLPVDVMHLDRRRYGDRARHLLELVGLGDSLHSYPHELSGGMQQRVALCRALVTDPRIVLMDEPFGALDELTRERLNVELLRIWQDARKTVLFVTHNIQEAVFLSDRVAVMGIQPGRILDVVDIELPRPRSSRSLDHDTFHRKVHSIRRLLGAEG